MRDRLVTTWLRRIAVLVILMATLFAIHANTVAARHCQDAPVPICEHIEGDAVDEMRLEHVTITPSSTVQHPVLAQTDTLVVLRLSPIIFQPPEAV